MFSKEAINLIKDIDKIGQPVHIIVSGRPSVNDFRAIGIDLHEYKNIVIVNTPDLTEITGERVPNLFVARDAIDEIPLEMWRVKVLPRLTVGGRKADVITTVTRYLEAKDALDNTYKDKVEVVKKDSFPVEEVLDSLDRFTQDLTIAMENLTTNIGKLLG